MQLSYAKLLSTQPKTLQNKIPPRRLHIVMATISDKNESRKARKENVAGSFFVDHTCIDCDTCRWMAPEVFTRSGEMSAVYHQPENKTERLKAMQALLACPTYSIHVDKLEKGELSEVHASFPIAVSGLENLFYCGYSDEKTFAATSYLIVRPEGNVMVDVPRFVPPLKNRIQEMGSIKYIFLTHIDDVGDHEKWAAHYGAQRIIHSYEVNRKTENCEIKLKGDGPWCFPDDPEMNELEIIHTPGHTRGSVCLWHKPSKVMFTGDHLAYSEVTSDATIFPMYNSYGIKRQIESVKKLMKFDFSNILPGHGRRMQFKDNEDRFDQLRLFLEEEPYDQRPPPIQKKYV